MLRIGFWIICLIIVAACSSDGSTSQTPTPNYPVRFVNLRHEEEFYTVSNVSIENCNGTSDVQQNISRSETTTVEIEMEASIDLSLQSFINGSIEARFAKRRGETVEVNQSFAVTVEARSSVAYRIEWYETWRVGELVIEELGLQIPFRVRTGLEGRLSTGEAQTCNRVSEPTLEASDTDAPATTQAPTSTICTVTVVTNELNFRTGPSVFYPRTGVQTLVMNTMATVIGRNRENTWWYINLNGDLGWISAGLEYSRTEGNCSNIPLVNPPPPPATTVAPPPTTIAPPIIITTVAPRNPSRSLLRCSSGNVSPDLFIAWEVSEDGLTWTFSLADSLILADGQWLTSHYIFDYYLNDFMSRYYPNSQTDIVDDYTIVINFFDYPSGNFPCNLSSISIELQR